MIVIGVSRILFGTLSRDYATTAKKGRSDCMGRPVVINLYCTRLQPLKSLGTIESTHFNQTHPACPIYDTFYESLLRQQTGGI